jgi:phosphoglycolate phosphatase-like HAD superfamily hydrolase
MPDERRIVCVDLNGVLNLYDGFRGADYIHPPRPGAKEFLEALRERGYRVVVFTDRWAPQVEEWLERAGLRLFVEEVTDRKPPAHAFIDDRAICFRGDYAESLAALDAFRAHWE